MARLGHGRARRVPLMEVGSRASVVGRRRGREAYGPAQWGFIMRVFEDSLNSSSKACATPREGDSLVRSCSRANDAAQKQNRTGPFFFSKSYNSIPFATEA
jgi:hypothetical protein